MERRPRRATRPRPTGVLPILLLSLVLPLSGCGVPAIPALPEPGRGPEEAAPDTAHAAAIQNERAHVGRNCFQRHLRDAIRLNEQRAPVYAGWTGGESEAVSRRLIRAEHRAELAAWWVDRRARRFHEAGIPIACAEFISMSLTPPLPPAPPPPPSQPYGPGPDPDSLASALAAAYGIGGFAGVRDAAERLLDSLEERPHYHCMVRHLAESVWRVAELAPLHAAAADAEGLPSTVPLSELLLRLHLAGLPEAARLDRDAAPLQQAGVPILCLDVPPIRHVR